MEIKDWENDQKRLLFALGKMETWIAMLLQSVQEAKTTVEQSADGFIFKSESHSVGVPEFEMAMRDIDSPLREILAVHQAILENYRDNGLTLKPDFLTGKPDFTEGEVVELLQVLQKATTGAESSAPVVAIVTKDKIELRIDEKCT